MRTYDLSPLYRYSVGFDRMNRLFDALARGDEAAPAYPPYDILKTGDNGYRITMAVAGFSEGDLDVTVKENRLIVTGRKDEKAEKGVEYLHHGITAVPFERTFELADHIRVSGARLVDGLLHVDLVREIPEEKKPRRIGIETGGSGKVIEHETAA